MEAEAEANHQESDITPEAQVRWADQADTNTDLSIFDNKVGFVQHESELQHDVRYAHASEEDAEWNTHHVSAAMSQSDIGSIHISDPPPDSVPASNDPQST